MKEKIILFIKKETVLMVAILLAIVSAFFVTPNRAYIDYIDWRVLGILLSLMIVMAGFQKNGIFDEIGKQLLVRTKNTAQLTGVLVFLCFFSSMLITNDVALITFVPFAVLTLRKCKQERLMVLVVVLQTIAANLGSMFTPIGNPQNLYLYQLSGMNMGEFLAYMLPYTAVSGLLLLITIFVLSARKQKISMADCSFETEKEPSDRKKNVVYLILFLLCLLVVARLLPYHVVLAIVLVTVLVTDRMVLKNVDYCLLFTFIAFFIFTGNLGNLSAFKEALQKIVSGRELLVGILASQCISNVPAALLLSGFTEDIRGLLLGVNIGGLGTLIASMASLISYKIYAHNYNRTKGKYLIWFTLANLIFLVVLLLLAEAIQI
ncbi:MAG: SLC13 family permease [Clostridiales bacterium]|nr:SLC13 family permease [Clostridiales bacterium]